MGEAALLRRKQPFGGGVGEGDRALRQEKSREGQIAEGARQFTGLAGSLFRFGNTGD